MLEPSESANPSTFLAWESNTNNWSLCLNMAIVVPWKVAKSYDEVVSAWYKALVRVCPPASTFAGKQVAAPTYDAPSLCWYNPPKTVKSDDKSLWVRSVNCYIPMELFTHNIWYSEFPSKTIVSRWWDPHVDGSVWKLVTRDIGSPPLVELTDYHFTYDCRYSSTK